MAVQKKHAEEVTKRFIKVMRYVLAEGLHDIRNRTDFAEAVGEYVQNISRMEAGTRYATVDMLCAACMKFDIAPAWMLLGRGEMKARAQKSLVTDLSAMDERLKEIERKLGKPVRTIKKKAV